MLLRNHGCVFLLLVVCSLVIASASIVPLEVARWRVHMVEVLLVIVLLAILWLIPKGIRSVHGLMLNLGLILAALPVAHFGVGGVVPFGSNAVPEYELREGDTLWYAPNDRKPRQIMSPLHERVVADLSNMHVKPFARYRESQGRLWCERDGKVIFEFQVRFGDVLFDGGRDYLATSAVWDATN